MSRFTLPRDIYYGANALENLKNLKGSRAVLVLGGGSMKKFGFVDKALGYLKEAGIETRPAPAPHGSPSDSSDFPAHWRHNRCLWEA